MSSPEENKIQEFMTDFEIQKTSRFFEILLKLEQRRRKQEDLRTDKNN